MVKDLRGNLRGSVLEQGPVDVAGDEADHGCLSKTVMDRRLAEELCAEILALPETEVLISGADVSYLCPKTPDLKRRCSCPRRP